MSAEKVLIVDDDDDILLIVQTILTSAGYTTFIARNGREGVDMALRLQPDLILLDVMMPELSGWEVCTTLKNAPETRQIPVAMLTVKSEIRDLITGMQVGADDYMTKPFTRRRLLSAVRKLLDERGEATSSAYLSTENEDARFRNLLFDPITELPTVPVIIDALRDRLRLGGLRQPLARRRQGAAPDARNGLRDGRLRRRQPRRRIGLLRLHDARSGGGLAGAPPAQGAARRGISARDAGRGLWSPHPQTDRRLRRAHRHSVRPADESRATGVQGAAAGDRHRDHKGGGAPVPPARELQGDSAQPPRPDRLPADLRPEHDGGLRARGIDPGARGHGLRESGAPLRFRRRVRGHLGPRATLHRVLGGPLLGAGRGAPLSQCRGGFDNGAGRAAGSPHAARASAAPRHPGGHGTFGYPRRAGLP